MKDHIRKIHLDKCLQTILTHTGVKGGVTGEENRICFNTSYLDATVVHSQAM